MAVWFVTAVRRSGWRRACGSIALLLAVAVSFLLLARAQTLRSRAPVTAAGTADRACAGCHRAIYDQYQSTPMARASGAATDGLLQGGFTHEASGVHYRVFEREGTPRLSFTRPAMAPGGYLSGELELKYFIGSNTRGRTYLFERDGYWFETPVNWYAKKRVWDMAPNYLQAHEAPLTLPVDANCLHCHVTGVAAALPGARNHFAAALFAQGGIGCSACHGDAAEHVRTQGRAPVLNPARLDAVKRDSVCLQCHLEGETAVYREGSSLAAFQPGENLFDSVSYFVHQGQSSGGHQRATSQYEALLESKCKRASGDALTCTTCHDPHTSQSSAPAAERIQHYRARCLACHTGEMFAMNHHPEQPDCAKCHMPRSASEDIAHEQVTDHRIQIPGSASLQTVGGASNNKGGGELTPIGNQAPGARELGLAYAQFSERGDRASGEMALTLLRKAETLESATAQDAELHTQLGFLEQTSGNIAAADREYRAALKADAGDGAARGNLAVLFAKTGDYATAVKLWQRVFADDPAESAAGYNLALGQCRLGLKSEAQATLIRLLQFSPDNQQARTLAASIAGGSQACKAH